LRYQNIIITLAKKKNAGIGSGETTLSISYGANYWHQCFWRNWCRRFTWLYLCGMCFYKPL